MRMPKAVCVLVVMLTLMCIPSLAQDIASKPMDMKNMPTNAEEMNSHMDQMRGYEERASER